MKNNKALLLLIGFLLSIVALSALFLYLFQMEVATPAEQPSTEPDYDYPLTIHFIDAGQGDATLIEGPDFTILIDAGRHDDERVIRYLNSTRVDHLDLLIGTHPHSDHIGQFSQILNRYPVDEVWMSGELHTTYTFERALDAILASDAAYREPRAGERYEVGSATLDVFHPAELIGDLNNGSIVVKLTFSELSVLFMGDAELPAELEILNRHHPVQADILKIGHHGSSSSSSIPFIEEVNPQAAIYSAGRDNTYGHPHFEVISRLLDRDIGVYGTDRNGTMRLFSDGQTYTLRNDQRILSRGTLSKMVLYDP